MEDFIMSKENEDVAKINEKEQYKYGKTTPTFKRITEFTTLLKKHNLRK